MKTGILFTPVVYECQEMCAPLQWCTHGALCTVYRTQSCKMSWTSGTNIGRMGVNTNFPETRFFYFFFVKLCSPKLLFLTSFLQFKCRNCYVLLAISYWGKIGLKVLLGENKLVFFNSGRAWLKLHWSSQNTAARKQLRIG